MQTTITVKDCSPEEFEKWLIKERACYDAMRFCKGLRPSEALKKCNRVSWLHFALVALGGYELAVELRNQFAAVDQSLREIREAAIDDAWRNHYYMRTSHDVVLRETASVVRDMAINAADKAYFENPLLIEATAKRLAALKAAFVFEPDNTQG